MESKINDLTAKVTKLGDQVKVSLKLLAAVDFNNVSNNAITCRN